MLLGDDPRDNNPVVSVEVSYLPDDHQWRVFHTLRNGLVVSRSEQYAINDASTDSIAQWQGSHGRMRQLYMIGEVKRGPKGIEYHEWQYNRNTNSMTMEMVTLCRTVAPIVAQTAPSRSEPDIVIERRPEPRQQVASVLYFQAASDVKIRRGPGSNHDLLGTIPTGVDVVAARCVPRDDGLAGADWCLISWRGLTGWGSRANLMPQ